MEAPKNKKKKIYVYVDESAQDDASEFFVVVAVVSVKDQEDTRKHLENIERAAGTNKKKWHKLRHEHRMRYCRLNLNSQGRRCIKANIHKLLQTSDRLQNRVEFPSLETRAVTNERSDFNDKTDGVAPFWR